MHNILHGWIVGQSGAILKTSNGGASWDSTYLGVSVDYFSVKFMDLDSGWIAGNSGTLLRTTNRGATWKRIASGTLFPIYSLKFIPPNVVYGAGFSTFIYSLDMGVTWQGRLVNPQSVFYDLSFSDASSGWLVGYGGDIVQTLDSGRSWMRRLNGNTNDFTDLAIVNSNTLISVGKTGIISRSTDGGTSFRSVQPSAFSTTLNAIDFASSTTGWVVGDSGKILKSQNQGANWSFQNFGTTKSLLCISMVDSMTGWAGGQRILLQTINGGTTWIQKTLPDTNAVISAMHFSHRNTGVILASKIGGYSTRILYTSDGGNNWFGRENSNTGAVYSMYFRDSLDGWAVGNGNTILGTQDGGLTWQAGILPFNRLYFTVFFIDDNYGWVGTGDGIVLKTTNAGGSWSQLFTNTSSDISKIKFFDPSLGWAVGPFGKIIKSINGGGAGIPVGRSHPPPVQRKTPPEMTNFPNPIIADSTWLPFDLSSTSRVTTRIYDLRGRLVWEFSSGTLLAGQYRTKGKAIFWNGRDMNNVRCPSGVYFYQIITDYTTINHKMILLR